MPLTSAASIALHRMLVPTTVAVFSALCARANLSATCPGGSSTPETIAASVSTT